LCFYCKSDHHRIASRDFRKPECLKAEETVFEGRSTSDFQRFPGMKPLALIATLFTSLSLWGCANKPQLTTVPSVDLGRYSGKWHEIAKYPNWFQRGCIAGAVAEYTPQPDSSV
jgi:hypothetical protein